MRWQSEGPLADVRMPCHMLSYALKYIIEEMCDVHGLVLVPVRQLVSHTSNGASGKTLWLAGCVMVSWTGGGDMPSMVCFWSRRRIWG